MSQNGTITFCTALLPLLCIFMYVISAIDDDDDDDDDTNNNNTQ